MLISLALRDVVLIDRLALEFGAGLTVLTGETGAGKSILLDGLGLALGARADTGLLAPGAGEVRATAVFALPPEHPARELLAEHGLAGEDEIRLRRIVGADGRSRAFINDQPVGVALLRRAGANLVEIAGQHEQLGLADGAVQRLLLDGFGVGPALKDEVTAAFASWHTAEAALDEARRAAEQGGSDAAWLAHAVDELQALAPEPDEEVRLAATRQALQQDERRAEAIAAALAELAPRERRGAAPAAAVRAAARALGRSGTAPAGKAGEAIAALERAEEALAEAESLLEEGAASLTGDPGGLERAEARLFALRAAARKYQTTVGELPEVAGRLAGELAEIEDRTALVARRAREATVFRTAYDEAAERLGRARLEAARRLEERIARELAPLKLDKARFECRVARLPEGGWGAHGRDAVSFLLAANPGQEPAPLSRAASGGELARLMLALKVALAGSRNPATLIFDEIDAGIGGAAAAAVGERLARIARHTQVLVVTHSPQVAVHGDQHIRITKETANGRMATRAVTLGAAARQEEIARMLAGATVTDAARAAAESLLAQPGPRRPRRAGQAGTRTGDAARS